MSRFSYESLLGDNVQFKQGTQAALNAYLPTSNDATKKGKAVEGAFYLTTDTHRLYIGRKVTSLPNPNPYNVAIDDVYPEEISTGIATVADTGTLAQIQADGSAHDGDFYYIKDGNVLAVYEENASSTGGSWQQINSPTGIASFTPTLSGVAPTDTPTFNSSSTYVRVRESIQPSGAGTVDSDFWLKAGDNITLKPSSNNKTVEISSVNSQSSLTLADSNATTNKAIATLSDSVNFDSNLAFVGAQDTTATAANTYKASTDTSIIAHKAYYTRSGSAEPYTYTLVESPTAGTNPSTSNYYEKESTITITGPGVNGTVITKQGTAGATTGNTGFKIAVQVKDGATITTDDRSITTSGIDNSYLDPIIRVGNSTTSDVKFHGGRADLPVYTKTETDTAISTAITNGLRGIDALHYAGTVASPTALGNLSNLQNGDVYKASADFSYTAGTDTVKVKTGDLLIAQGTETNGVITSGLSWELVPSGDEPLLKGVFNTTQVSFGLEDQNITASYNANSTDTDARLAKRPLQVQFDNSNSTLISASMTGDAADKLKIALSHTVPASGNVTTITSATVTGTGTDTLSTKDQTATFVALSSITRDAYGHVTDVAGQTITLKHNYLTATTATHSAGSTSTGTYGQALIGATDAFGFATNMTKGAVKITSDTLKITAPNTNDSMNIDLVWQDF